MGGAWKRGLGFDDVLPYFVRRETDTDFGDQPWHGDRGPMPSTRYLDIEDSDPLAAAMDALQAAGFPMVEDHNRPGAVGAGRMPMSSRAGARVTTADAYLPVGSTPENLTIRAGAQVADVVFDGARALRRATDRGNSDRGGMGRAVSRDVWQPSHPDALGGWTG